jgi:DNA-binding response OmpR family regulator
MTKLLLVEDAIDVATPLAMTLRAVGFVIDDIVDSGEAALEIVANAPPDIVLLDIDLAGDLDGVETAMQLSKSQVPVVFITGHRDDATLQRALQTHAFGYVSKPFNFVELRMAIDLAIRNGFRERRVCKQRDAMQEVLEQIDHGVIITDADGSINYLNRHAEALTGCATSQAIQRNIVDVLQAVDDGCMPENPIATALAAESPLELSGARIRNAITGDTVVLQDGSAVVPFAGGDDRHAAALTLRADVTPTTEAHTETVCIREYLDTVIAGLVRAYETVGRISIDFDSTTVDVDVHVAFPCGMIVNELVGKVVQHALEADCAGTITVRFEIRPNNNAVLTITEDVIRQQQGDPLQFSMNRFDLFQCLVHELTDAVEIQGGDATTFQIAFPLDASLSSVN